MNILKGIFTRQFFITLLLLGLLALFALPLTKNWRQKRAIDKEIAELEQQVSSFENKNSSLRQVLDYMQSEQFVEEEARSKLNYKKPGEQVVVIEGLPSESGATASASALFDFPAPPPDKNAELRLSGNLKRWLEYFFN
jgi:cell division protein FtsB